MKKFFGYLLSPIHYLVFGFWLGVFQPLQWLSYKLGGYKAHKKVVDWLNLCLESTYYLLATPVKFVNQQALPLNRPIIFVANHQSMYDIPPIIWHLRKHHAKFISKIELTKGIPSISFNLKYGGGANIDRNDSKQAITEIIKLAQRMREQKWSAVIFPEGTRSKTGAVKDFQAGGIATILKKCPEALVVPIAINNAWKMVQYGIFPLDAFNKITITVLKPIEPAGQTVDEVVGQAYQAIKQQLGQ